MPINKKSGIAFLAFFNAAFILALLCAGEFLLKKSAVIPGNLAPNWSYFKKLDSLECQQQFVVDSKGLLKASPEYFEPQGIAINSEGFRGEEFNLDSPAGSTVLLIGDSFGWGASAEPHDSSFAARIDASGFEVYNCAIPGTDPAQYEAIAAEYIPRLKPDFVLVIFYMGNDIMQKEREPIPGQELYFQCAQGWLLATDGDVYFDTPEKAYEHYLSLHTVTDEWPFTLRLLAKTRIGTMLIAAPRKVREYLKWRNMKTPPYSANHLRSIVETAEEHKAAVVLAVIPEVRYASVPPKELRPQLFGDLPVVFMSDLDERDFNPLPDGHFNNRGHRRFAHFLLNEMSHARSAN